MERDLEEVSVGDRMWEWHYVNSQRDLRETYRELDPIAKARSMSSCGALTIDPGLRKIYWIDRLGRGIQHTNLEEPRRIEEIRFDGDGWATAIAVQTRTHQIYWAFHDANSGNSIFCADPGGKNLKRYSVDGIEGPLQRIAFDDRGDEFYWRTWEHFGRGIVGVKGSTETLSGRWSGAPELMVDPEASSCFFTLPKTIVKGDLEGEILQSFEAVGARSIAGGADRDLYWGSTSVPRSIRRLDLEEETSELLIRTSSVDFGRIAVDSVGGRLYFSDAFGDRIWKCRTDGSEIESFVERRPAVAFRARVPLVAFEGGGGIESVDLSSGRTVKWRGPDHDTRCPALSADGGTMGAIGQNELLIWTEESGDPNVFPVATEAIFGIRLSPRGRYVGVERPYGFELLEVSTGRILWGISFEDSDLSYETRFCAEGGRVLISRYSSNEFLVRDTASGEEIRSLVWRTLDDHPLSAINRDGSKLAIVSDHRRVDLIDLESRERYAYLPDVKHAVGLSFLDGGASLAVVSQDGFYSRRLPASKLGGLLEIWSIEGGLSTLSCRIANVFRPSVLASSDGERIAVADANSAQVVNLRRRQVRVLEGHSSYVYYVAFSGDGSMIASAAWDRTVRLWDAIDGSLLKTFEPLRPVPDFHDTGLAFSADGNTLHLGAEVWDLGTGERLAVAQEGDWDEGAPVAERWGGYWNRVLGGAKAHHFGDFAGENEASSQDRSLVARGLNDGRVLLTDRLTGVERTIRTGHGESEPCRVRSVAVSPDNSRLVAGGLDGTLRVIDLETETVIACLERHGSDVFSVGFSPDGKRFFSGGRDRFVMVWDMESLEPLIELTGARDYVHSVAMSPDGKQIAAGSGDGNLYLWDSVPRVEREEETRSWHNLMERLRPFVSEVLAQSGSPSAAAHRLRTDEVLSSTERSAALRVLLEKSMGSEESSSENVGGSTSSR